jgi:hypothetical protein
VSAPLALFEGPLTGHELVRNIYTDEAGTSAREPVTVVAALIVHADTQWLPVARELDSLLHKKVPQKYWKNGHPPPFHAKYISSHSKYPDWSKTERHDLMKLVMGLPFKFGIPIAIGAVKRGQSSWADKDKSPEQLDHIMAFALCMGRADHFVRTFCGMEMATVVAEDVQKMRGFLRVALNALRVKPLHFAQMFQTGSSQPKRDASKESYRVERIIDEVHFMVRIPRMPAGDSSRCRAIVPSDVGPGVSRT